MRFTNEVVTRAAAWAEEVTGGAFQLASVGGDLGHGVRYFDGIEQLAWSGTTGAREAAAYYLSAGATWVELSDGTMPPEWAATLAVLRESTQPESVRGWAERGCATARGRRESGLRWPRRGQ